MGVRRGGVILEVPPSNVQCIVFAAWRVRQSEGGDESRGRGRERVGEGTLRGIGLQGVCPHCCH